MNNLLLQPAQLPVKAAVPGPAESHAGRGDASAGIDHQERSFEKTLQKARRRNVPDEQEQTLASEAMPVQSAYAQSQAAQEANAQTNAQANAQSGSQANSQQGNPAGNKQALAAAVGAAPSVDMAALLPVLKGTVLAAAGQASAQAAGTQAVLDVAAAPALTAEQMAALAAQTAKTTQTQAETPVSGEGTQPEPVEGELPAEFGDILKKLQKAAAKSELTTETAVEDKQPKLQQPVSVETKQAEAKTQLEVKGQPEFEASSAIKKDQPAVKTSQPDILVMEPAAGSKGTASTSNIAEPARMAEARQVHVLRQVADGVETMTRSGQNTLRLQLNPENLGKIDLRMTLSKEGMLVTLLTDTQTTSSMLSQHLAELRTTLTEAGVTLAGLSVNSGNIGGQSLSQEQRQANYSQQQFGQSGSLAAEKIADPREAVRLRDADANVDYLV